MQGGDAGQAIPLNPAFVNLLNRPGPGPGYTTAAYAYDAQHRLIATRRDGATVEVRHYDAAGRVVMQQA
jgi:YD repeat-containing protein